MRLPPRAEKMTCPGEILDQYSSILLSRHHTALSASSPDKKTSQSRGMSASSATKSMFFAIRVRLVIHCDLEFLYPMLSEMARCTLSTCVGGQNRGHVDRCQKRGRGSLGQESDAALADRAAVSSVREVLTI